MPHPNSLPESKEYYVRSLAMRRRIASRLVEQGPSIALVMYHAEVPYENARQYINNLANMGYRAPGDPQALPNRGIEQMLLTAGAPPQAAASYTATIAAKRG